MRPYVPLILLAVCTCGPVVLRHTPTIAKAAGDPAHGSSSEACPAIELGTVAWGYDLDAATARSREDGRPVFLLFQEVPGCATCRNFGSGPLSHPLLVEAIESEFHPVMVYNNRGGADERIRNAFREPAWNNPVVRFLDGRRNDVIPRRDRVWSIAGVARRMMDALEATKREVPRYLSLVAEEDTATSTQQATFAMHCFWQGAAAIGDIAGVLNVRAGFLGGGEVVETTFDPSVIRIEDLAAEVHRRGQARRVFVADAALQRRLEDVIPNVVLQDSMMRPAGDSDQLYYLRHSRFRGLDLQGLQAVRVNAELGRGGAPETWLSPRQRERLEREG